ncbi:mono/diheme cytochrome c family protein [Sphingomonas vulcanisoli]|uniref:Mono/diheme cytochrome c family protein n=1 Tax=Sphingomonas vulcanisoli TaxID=1658060 RepID=A0ABX0TQZ6_9SPHN|nr:cytochrome c [Sphingomonas vulcanisoli]NIJ07154.1 mono/diheme cytochrome c family protein [Sphingomonas vulcanisoli]
MRAPLVITIALIALAAPTMTRADTTTQGVYTDDQAAEGAKLYAGQCAMCHGKRLEGTLENPALSGGRFLGNWSHGSVAALADYIHRAMPQMAPGTLTPENSARVVAYLLQQNGMPAGKAALPSDPAALAKIPIGPIKP